jgi:hypothetical protein
MSNRAIILLLWASALLQKAIVQLAVQAGKSPASPPGHACRGHHVRTVDFPLG